MLHHQDVFQWAVIGAGPAGIAVVGRLIDHGISPKQIAWIDLTFKVGDFGNKWRNVSSNTTVQLFLKFLHESKSFAYGDFSHNFAITHLNPEDTCDLHYMATPLQKITEHLAAQVFIKKAIAKKLTLRNRAWQIHLNENSLFAKNVVLAIGVEEKSLNYPDIETIPLDVAMDKKLLQAQCDEKDNVAVFGSSHSAIIALRNLLEIPVQQVINFYRSPLCYATYLNDWILFDNIGLKGHAAKWARAMIDGELHTNLTRIYSSAENINHYLSSCNKVVYAIGFERRQLPVVEDFPTLNYNPQNGIIAPGLFGVGIAFPEAQYDRFGTLEHRVGLWKFMDYLNRVMPLWLQYNS